MSTHQNPSGTTEVNIKWEGKTHQIHCNPSESILEAALRNQIDLPYSCMSGTCNSCSGHLKEGHVDMAETFMLSDEEIKEGKILLCQAKPTTTKVLVEVE